MTAIICLHGNPGKGNEFEPLMFLMDKSGFDFRLHLRPLKGSSMEQLLQSCDAIVDSCADQGVGFLTYSWGSYLALAYLAQFPGKVKGVFMVNPFVVDKNPLSLPARSLLNVPFLNTAILKIINSPLRKKFIEKLFFPEKPPADALCSLEIFLSDTDVWKGAMAYKELMAQHPLTADTQSISAPIKALFGENDALAQPAEQLSFLKRFAQFESEVVPNAGHSLLYTHPDLLAEKLNRFFRGSV